MSLTTERETNLRKRMVASFDLASLTLFLHDWLNVDIESVIAVHGLSFEQQCYHVIKWAKREGQLMRFLQAIQTHHTNSTFKVFVAQLVEPAAHAHLEEIGASPSAAQILTNPLPPIPVPPIANFTQPHDAAGSPGVFISYSHADERWLKPLLTKLKPVLRREPTAVWWDAKINAGQKWRAEIDRALSAVKVGVLLVSDNFLASEFITNRELPYLLNAAKQRGVKLLAVLINACFYGETELKDFQFLHDVTKPLNSLNGAKRDKLLHTICQAIRDEIGRPAC